MWQDNPLDNRSLSISAALMGGIVQIEAEVDRARGAGFAGVCSLLGSAYLLDNGRMTETSYRLVPFANGSA